MGERGIQIAAIDQKWKTVGTTTRHAWLPKHTSTLEVSTSREAVKLFGAVTEDGETFFRLQEENFTQETVIRFLQDLTSEYGDNLCVLLDNAPYFTAKKVKAFAAERGAELMYFPRYSPDMNPMEEIWRQYENNLGNMLFTSLAEVRLATSEALSRTSAPNIAHYIG